MAAEGDSTPKSAPFFSITGSALPECVACRKSGFIERGLGWRLNFVLSYIFASRARVFACLPHENPRALILGDLVQFGFQSLFFWGHEVKPLVTGSDVIDDFGFMVFCVFVVCSTVINRQLYLMGVCVFVASGLNFDVDRYLGSSPFKPMAVFRKGDIPPKNNPEKKPRPDSGFVVLISGDREVSLSQQLSQALAFLTQHSSELQTIRTVGVDNMLMDLGVEVGNKLQQAEYLPPELIAALGRLGMGLIFSVVTLPRG